MYFLTIVCCFFALLDLINLSRQTPDWSMRTIQQLLRSEYFQSNSSQWLNMLSFLVIQPIALAIPALAASDYWIGKKDRKLMILSLIMMVLRVLSTGNRGIIIIFFIYFLVAGLLVNSSKVNTIIKILKKKKQRNKRLIIYVALVGIALFVFMTVFSRQSTLFRNVYLNFAMPPSMLEVWINEVEYQNLIGFGMASLNGFINPIFYILRNIFGLQTPVHFQNIYDLTMLTDVRWVRIGDEIIANAYVTGFWFLYLDGRIFGVIIGMFLYGAILAKSFTKTIKTLSVKQVSLYCMHFHGLFFSFIRIPFTQVRFVIALLFISLISFQTEKK